MSAEIRFPDSEANDLNKIGYDVQKQAHIDPVFERQTVRFVDWRVLPLLALVYAFALIDRVNLGSSRVLGMGKDLKLTVGARFSLVSLIYFIPTIFLQLPGNLLLRKIGARALLAACVLGWGAVVVAMGFVKDWQMLLLCRFFLGVFESAFLPALTFIIATWYTRHEVQLRLAWFFLLSIGFSACSPTFAYGFSLLGGRLGIAGWRWIFIIEGAITLALGLLTWLLVPDFPDNDRFLSEKRKALILRRVEEDRADSVPDEITIAKIKEHLSDWTLFAYGIMFMCSALPAYALAYFLPIILEGMGKTAKESVLLSSPPYLPAIATALVFAWLSDRTKHRAGFIAIQSVICIVGLIVLGWAKDPSARYGGSFLVISGNTGTIPGIMAYGANNVRTHSKRSIQTAVTLSFGGISGIMATTVFRQQDAPNYLPGILATIGSQILIIVLLAVTTFHFRRQNKLSREGKLDRPLEGLSGFYYTL